MIAEEVKIEVKEEKPDMSEDWQQTVKKEKAAPEFVDCEKVVEDDIKEETSEALFDGDPLLPEDNEITTVKRTVFLDIVMEEKKSSEIFQCLICKKIFKKDINLLEDSITSNMASNPCICEVCCKELETKHSRQVHMPHQVTDKSPACEVGGKSPSVEAGFTSHEEEHIGDKISASCTGKGYTCNIGQCRKSFKFKAGLENHMVVHSGIHKCDVCSRSFPSDASLNGHKLIHIGGIPYVCEVCNERFKLKIDLQLHKLIHSGKKPVACDVCNRCFPSISYLKSHAVVHSKDKLYSCNLCKKKFKTENSIKRHRSLHYRQIGNCFSCDFCSKDFKFLRDFKAHKLIHSRKSSR